MYFVIPTLLQSSRRRYQWIHTAISFVEYYELSVNSHVCACHVRKGFIPPHSSRTLFYFPIYVLASTFRNFRASSSLLTNRIRFQFSPLLSFVQKIARSEFDKEKKIGGDVPIFAIRTNTHLTRRHIHFSPQNTIDRYPKFRITRELRTRYPYAGWDRVVFKMASRVHPFGEEKKKIPCRLSYQKGNERRHDGRHPSKNNLFEVRRNSEEIRFSRRFSYKFFDLAD